MPCGAHCSVDLDCPRAVHGKQLPVRSNALVKTCDQNQETAAAPRNLLRKRCAALFGSAYGPAPLLSHKASDPVPRFVIVHAAKPVTKTRVANAPKRQADEFNKPRLSLFCCQRTAAALLKSALEEDERQRWVNAEWTPDERRRPQRCDGLQIRCRVPYIKLSGATLAMAINVDQEERSHLTREALSEVDAGRVIDHQAVKAWAESLSTEMPLPMPHWRCKSNF